MNKKDKNFQVHQKSKKKLKNGWMILKMMVSKMLIIKLKTGKNYYNYMKS